MAHLPVRGTKGHWEHRELGGAWTSPLEAQQEEGPCAVSSTRGADTAQAEVPAYPSPGPVLLLWTPQSTSEEELQACTHPVPCCPRGLPSNRPRPQITLL